MKPLTILIVLLTVLTEASAIFLSGCRGSTGTGGGATGDGSVTTGAAIEVKVDVSETSTPISPYIYGVHHYIIFPPFSNSFPAGGTRANFVRMGGDDWTPYNWENNATNSGPHAPKNRNLSFEASFSLDADTDKPGESVVKRIKRAHALGAAALVTVPITDYVAADKNGIVTEKGTDGGSRWVQNKAVKSGDLTMTPDLPDKVVYQDEFVHFIQQTFKDSLSQGKKIFYCLDNEPGLWSDDHPLIHPDKPTYAEMAERMRRFGTMIKRLAPDTLVFGPVSYGFGEFTTLQNAPDREGRGEFLDFYLKEAKKLEESEKKRVLDVLDIHWYPEKTVAGKPLSDPGPGAAPQNPNPSKEEIEARVQLPRSLRDSDYIEVPEVTKNYYGEPKPFRLIPWLKEKIATNYPGTKIGISEYNYGSGSHISHAVAHADALGVFGREGLFSANFLALEEISSPNYIDGAFAMYLDYDGKGSAVGDLSIPVTNPDITRLSVYAMKSTKDPGLLHLVVINKTAQEVPLTLTLAGGGFSTANAFRLTQARKMPQPAGKVELSGEKLADKLPPLSVTTVEVRK